MEANDAKWKVHSLCHAPWSTINITYTGSVAPCCQNENFQKFGNIKEKSIREIWFGENFQELREGLVTGNHTLTRSRRENRLFLTPVDAAHGIPLRLR